MSGTTLKALFTVLATLAAWSVWAQQPADTKVDDLPLVEVPAPDSNTDTLCVIVSGDGGWAAIDKGISAALAKQGIPVVGLNALKYFWSARTPDQSAKDLERILRHYLAAWKKQKVLLVGYSFGADVIPFMATRLPDDLRNAGGAGSDVERITQCDVSIPLLRLAARTNGKERISHEVGDREAQRAESALRIRCGGYRLRVRGLGSRNGSRHPPAWGAPFSTVITTLWRR